MRRQVIDGVILGLIVALAASQLWADGIGRRTVVRPIQPGIIVSQGTMTVTTAAGAVLPGAR